MNIEEPVFNIIHNYRKPEARNLRVEEPNLENDSEPMELVEPPSTEATLSLDNEIIRDEV